MILTKKEYKILGQYVVAKKYLGCFYCKNRTNCQNLCDKAIYHYAHITKLVDNFKAIKDKYVVDDATSDEFNCIIDSIATMQSVLTKAEIMIDGLRIEMAMHQNIEACITYDSRVIKIAKRKEV